MSDKGASHEQGTNERLRARTRRPRALHNKGRNLEEKWAQSRNISGVLGRHRALRPRLLMWICRDATDLCAD